MGEKKISKNNIWNKTDFRLYAMGEKNKIIAAVKYIRNRMIWSWQRLPEDMRNVINGECMDIYRD